MTNKGLRKAYRGASQDLESNMARVVDPRDRRVSGFMRSALNREFVTAKDNLRRSRRQEKIGDIEMSEAMAQQQLTSEKRMTVDATQMYNQTMERSVANQYQYGDFATNIASGLGQGAADYYFAQKMGA
jgi:hypothetical protein